MIRVCLCRPARAQFARSAPSPETRTADPFAFDPRNTPLSPPNKTKPPRQPQNPFSTLQSRFLPSPAHYFLTERSHRIFFQITPSLHPPNTRTLPPSAAPSEFITLSSLSP